MFLSRSVESATEAIFLHFIVFHMLLTNNKY